ncbi:MAG: hypothetical protein E7047_00990 [Lentisphaerae bacterium]|nr:hypothetical protein [Lentisphaerota bacterium]
MSRKRGFTVPSSLDLLLDAMCNVFGAVLFAAILLGGSSVAERLSGNSNMVDKAAFDRLQTELEVTEDQLKALNMEYAILQNLAPVAEAQTQADQQLQQRYRQQTERANALAAELETMQTELDKLRRQQAVLQRWQGKSDELSRYLAAEQSKLQTQLKHTDIERVKLPELSGVNGQEPWWLLVTSNEIFVIGSNKHVRDLQSSGGGIRINMVSQDGEDYYKLRKLPGQGIKLNEFDFKKMAMPENQDKKFFPALLCEPDATANCALLIRELRRSQISYFWKIVPGNGAFLRTAREAKYEVAH